MWSIITLPHNDKNRGKFLFEFLAILIIMWKQEYIRDVYMYGSMCIRSVAALGGRFHGYVQK